MNSKRNFDKKKRLFIGIFAVLVMCITLGYAIIETTLSINGNATIDKVGWDIHFENIRVTDGSRILTQEDKAEGFFEPKIDSVDKTKLSYKIFLKEPGDYYEFIVDVVNSGTLPAKLNGIQNTQLTEEEDVYTNYSVTYIDGTSPTIGEKLAVGGRKTLKVRIEFDRNIEAKDLPTERHSFDLVYKLNYVQDK